MISDYTSDGNAAELPAMPPRVTPCMVRARTVELAIIAGRGPLEIRQRDYERAKRELTGETDFERQLEILYPNS